MPINYYVFPTKEFAAQAAGIELAETFYHDQNANVGLATGNTMIPVYSTCIKHLGILKPTVVLSKRHTFNLDEWCFADQKKLPSDDVRTFNSFMERNLFRGLGEFGFNINNAHFPSDELNLLSPVKSGQKIVSYDA